MSRRLQRGDRVTLGARATQGTVILRKGETVAVAFDNGVIAQYAEWMLTRVVAG